jgi:protein TonB
MMAREARIGGTVIVEVTIDERGNVISAKAIRATVRKPKGMSDDEARHHGETLKKASVEAAQKWKFKPTKLGGTPIKVIGTITFNFNP